MKFNKPTLITLTAPTCSGKTFLIEKLVELGLPRVVGTTTRQPRDGEVDGVDYYFITPLQCEKWEAEGKYVELVEFRGVKYGTTHTEIDAKMAGDVPPVLILEPEGLKAYEKICKTKGWDIFKVYVSTTEKIRLDRLSARTAADIAAILKHFHNDHLDCFGYNVQFAAETTKLPTEKIDKIIKTHTDRLLSITGDERLWQTKNTWDAIVPGNDINKALSYIEQGIKCRNSPKGVVTT